MRDEDRIPFFLSQTVHFLVADLPLPIEMDMVDARYYNGSVYFQFQYARGRNLIYLRLKNFPRHFLLPLAVLVLRFAFISITFHPTFSSTLSLSSYLNTTASTTLSYSPRKKLPRAFRPCSLRLPVTRIMHQSLNPPPFYITCTLIPITTSQPPTTGLHHCRQQI